MADEKRMKLLKFGADYCGPCKSMARARTLEKFAERHPDIELEIIDIEADEKRADEYDFRGIPAFVFEDMDGNIIHSDEGATNEAGLEKHYQKALKALEEGNFGTVRRKKKRRRADS